MKAGGDNPTSLYTTSSGVCPGEAADVEAVAAKSTNANIARRPKNFFIRFWFLWIKGLIETGRKDRMRGGNGKGQFFEAQSPKFKVPNSKVNSQGKDFKGWILQAL